jgi:hypothetical protein
MSCIIGIRAKVTRTGLRAEFTRPFSVSAVAPKHAAVHPKLEEIADFDNLLYAWKIVGDLVPFRVRHESTIAPCRYSTPHCISAETIPNQRPRAKRIRT